MREFLQRNPRFLRFWMATWASELGDWVRNITMTFLVLDLTNGSAMSLSVNLFCEFAPIFFFGLFVGALADRWNRKKTIMGAFAFRAIIMLCLIFAYLTGSLYLIYACAFVSAFGTLFFRSSSMAFMMLFVEPEDRKLAASMRQTSNSTMMLLGPSLGASFYLWIGTPGSLAVTITLFLTAVLLISTIQVEQPALSSQRTFGGIWKDILDGFHYSWNNPYVRPLLFINIMYGMAAGLINVLEVFIITDFLDLPKEMMAMLASIQGGGMFLASLFIGKWKLPMQRMVPLGMMVAGVFLSGMVAYKSFYATAGSLVLFSVGLMMVNIGMSALLQNKVDFAFQGRSGMSISTTFNGVMVTTMLMSGWLHMTFSIRPVIMVSGLLAALSGLVLYGVFDRNVRRESGMVPVESEAV